MNAFYFNQRLSARILAVVALFSLVASLVPMQAFAQVLIFSASVNPASIGVGQTVPVTFTIGNNISSTKDIKAIRISVPAGFSAANFAISQANWGVALNSGEIQASLNSGPTGLIPGNQLTITANITNVSASGTTSWTTCTFINSSFAPGGGGDFNILGGTGCASLAVSVPPTPCPPGTTGPGMPNCTPIPPPPIPCEAPYTGNVPNCVPPPCPQGQTGTYPNCVTPPTPCEAPYTGNVPNCVPPPCPQGQTGTYPNCVTPPPPSCSDGIQNQDETGIDSGGVCTPPPTPCDAPYTGFVPNCVPPPCPQGQTGTFPNCVTPPTPCDAPYTGFVPNCVPPPCPQGQTGTFPNCVTPPPPTCFDQIQNQGETGVDTGGPCGGGGPDPIYGCTDKTATNYNPRATNDDESCDFNYQSQCLTTPANLLTNGSFEADQGLTNGNWGIFTSVLGWASANVNSDGLEIWRGLITPSDGAQNAELDGNVPTTISQTVATIPGATYELRFDFAARANTGGASNNAVKAIVDGNTVVNQSTANTNWTTYGSTFVADASTDISISDIGTPADSYGTLIDNAVLCLVREPVVDFCPNILGDQAVDSYVKDVNGQCYTPIDSCELSVVSDKTNLEGDSAALIVTPHPVWLASITDSVAQWIWGSSVDTPISGTVDETQTFTKTFVWSGTPATAILEIASDNGYSVELNGTVVGSDAGEYNYSSSDTIINLTDDLIQGVNTLEISVTNKANGATSLNIVDGNPAGLLYDLTITNTTGDCAPDGGGDNDDELSCSITASDTEIRRGSDVTINWSSVDAAYVTIPNLGDELGTSGSQLVENLGEDTTYTMTVFGDVIGNTDTREQATCSVTVDTRSGGGGGGGNRVDRTPDGDVLGASDDKKPTGEVLGAQTDAIPTGAPNTGKGGSSTEVFGQFLATPRRRNHA